MNLEDNDKQTLIKEQLKIQSLLQEIREARDSMNAEQLLKIRLELDKQLSNVKNLMGKKYD
jgi:hypothetical protein